MSHPNSEMISGARGSKKRWDPDQPVTTDLRRPQSVSTPSGPSGVKSASSNSDVSDVLSVALQSTLSVNAKSFVPLSVNAKEFVPRGIVPPGPQTDEVTYHGPDEEYQFRYENSAEGSEASDKDEIYQFMLDVIKDLMIDPGQFENLADPLLDVLIPYFDSDDIIDVIVKLIIEESIKEQNFRYSGARLCNFLMNGVLPETQKKFRNTLLATLEKENDKLEENLEKGNQRVFGFVQFLGELYIQLQVNKETNQRMKILGSALISALKQLMQIPLPDNIRNVSNTLKLTGSILEADHPDEFCKFVSEFQDLLSDERAGSQVKNMIDNILTLRQNNWGRSSSASSSRSQSLNEADFTDEGTFYGPDRTAITNEEYQFCYENCGEDIDAIAGDPIHWDAEANDTENDEVNAAFRAFLNHKATS